MTPIPAFGFLNHGPSLGPASFCPSVLPGSLWPSLDEEGQVWGNPWASEAPLTAWVSQSRPPAVPSCTNVPSARQTLSPVPSHEKKNEKSEKIMKGTDLRGESFHTHTLPTTCCVHPAQLIQPCAPRVLGLLSILRQCQEQHMARSAPLIIIS